MHVSPAVPWDFLESVGALQGRTFPPALRQKLRLVGGGGIYPVRLCHALSSSIEVELVAPAPFKEQIAINESFRLTLVKAGYSRPFRAANPLAWPPGALLRSCDAVHIHQIHKALSNTSILRSKGKPIYVTHHAGKSLSLGLYRAYTAHLAVSRFSARLYRDKIRRSMVIYGGADIPTYRPDVPDIACTIEEHGGPVLLFVGVFRRNKNIPELIDSTARLCNMGLDPLLVLCGEAWTAEEMAKLASSVPRDIRGNVLFTSFLDEGRKNCLYSLCDIFVSASSHEYLGLVFIEAMMEAKPVVARRVGGVPEVVTDGVTGLLYGESAQNVGEGTEDLTRKLALLLEDPGLARRMGMKGMERANAFFTWNHVAERTLSRYREGQTNGSS